MALMEEKEAVKYESNQLKTVNEMLKSVTSLESKKLDLSRRRIKDFPVELNSLRKLEFLYLEGNSLTCLPDEFFICLPLLKWLDLRNNQITHLPATIGESRCLRSLLLEDNKITKLPLELGFVQSLSGLHLSGNPLEFPPPSIKEQGVQVILAFLRDEWMKKHKDDNDFPIDDEADKKEHDEIKPERKERAQSPARDKSPELKLPPIHTNLSSTAANAPKNRTLNGTESDRKSAGIFFKKQQASSDDITRRQSSSKNLSANSEKDKKRDTVKISTVENKVDERVSQNDAKSPKKKSSKQKKKSKHAKDRTTVLNAKVKDGGTVSLTYETEMKKKPSSDQREDEIMREEKQIVFDEEKVNLVKTQEFFESATITDNQQQKNLMKYAPSDLSVDDMVVLKVPEEHFIPGQPCLGKIVSLPDATGSLLVHYYSGSFDGVWKPMMSRSSPYLRRASLCKVLYKFELDEAGRMSKETIERVKEAIATQHEP